MIGRIPTYVKCLGIFVALSILQTSAIAQETVEVDTFTREKIPILVEPMQFSDDIPPSLVERLQLAAYKLLELHWHFEVINHSTEQNTGEVDPEYIFQLSLQPLIDELSQRDVLDSNKVLVRTSYSLQAGIRLNLRVTDIVTGELKYSRDVESVQRTSGNKFFRPPSMHFAEDSKAAASRTSSLSGYKYPFPSSPEAEAQILQEQKNRLLTKSLDAFPDIWNRALSELFPVAIHLVEVIDGSAKKPKKILIDAGEDFGVEIGWPMDLFTYKVYRAMGEEFVREETIGNFYPYKIGPNSTVGRIWGGRKEVGEALARGEKVFLRFRPQLKQLMDRASNYGY